MPVCNSSSPSIWIESNKFESGWGSGSQGKRIVIITYAIVIDKVICYLRFKACGV
jgi:hypothetical protein